MTLSSPAGSPPTPETTPNLADILQYLIGTAELMAGRSEGLRRLDLSADGFWTSFFALVVALPPLALSWVEFETVERPAPVVDTSAFLTYGVHAIGDVVAWLLPVAILIVVARWIGFSRKIVPLVVATNWGGALIAWASVPYYLAAAVLGGTVVQPLGSLLAIATIVLTVRLVSTAIGRDLPSAIAIVALMWVVGLMSYGAVIDITGVPLI